LQLGTSNVLTFSNFVSWANHQVDNKFIFKTSVSRWKNGELPHGSIDPYAENVELSTYI